MAAANVENEFKLALSADVAVAVAAIKALTNVIKTSQATTVMGLEIELKAAAEQLKQCVNAPNLISLVAGCELFMRYVTRTSLHHPDFMDCKAKLIERGEWFAEMSMMSRQKIAEYGTRFVRDGKVVLTHGFSRVVLGILLHAAANGVNFRVIVTEGRPEGAGYAKARRLAENGIPVSVVLDSAVAYVMNDVDLVLVGAEGVVENGGIINKVGTYQIAIVAKALTKPFYVAAECYKFARYFPLTQRDLPESKEALEPCVPQGPFPPLLKLENSHRDYTPPSFITLLLTDLGVLTPSAVSDELIKLYY